MEISTTNPAAPTGVTPTEVPLGITSTTTQSGGPVNIKPSLSKSLMINTSVYIGKFTITSSTSIGTSVFTFTTKYPLGDFDNRYNNNSQANSTIQYFVPWSLVPAFYSKQCKIEYELEFVPVKVADCRALLDIIYNYDDGVAMPSDPLLYLANDTETIKLDSQNEPLNMVIPQFFMTENIQTDTFRAIKSLAPTHRENIQPAFLPTTSIEVRIRNPYQPNLTQPTSFEVLVFLKPIVTSALAIGGKSGVANQFPDSDFYIPTPYFLNKRTF